MNDFELDRTDTLDNILLDQTDFFRMRKVSHDIVDSLLLPPNLAKRYSKITLNRSQDADTTEQNGKDIFLSPEMPTKMIKNKNHLNQHQHYHKRYHRNGQAQAQHSMIRSQTSQQIKSILPSGFANKSAQLPGMMKKGASQRHVITVGKLGVQFKQPKHISMQQKQKNKFRQKQWQYQQNQDIKNEVKPKIVQKVPKSGAHNNNSNKQGLQRQATNFIKADYIKRRQSIAEIPKGHKLIRSLSSIVGILPAGLQPLKRSISLLQGAKSDDELSSDDNRLSNDDQNESDPQRLKNLSLYIDKMHFKNHSNDVKKAIEQSMQVGNSIIPEEEQKTRGLTNSQQILDVGGNSENNKLTLEEMRKQIIDQYANFRKRMPISFGSKANSQISDEEQDQQKLQMSNKYFLENEKAWNREKAIKMSQPAYRLAKELESTLIDQNKDKQKGQKSANDILQKDHYRSRQEVYDLLKPALRRYQKTINQSGNKPQGGHNFNRRRASFDETASNKKSGKFQTPQKNQQQVIKQQQLQSDHKSRSVVKEDILHFPVRDIQSKSLSSRKRQQSAKIRYVGNNKNNQAAIGTNINLQQDCSYSGCSPSMKGSIKIQESYGAMVKQNQQVITVSNFDDGKIQKSVSKKIMVNGDRKKSKSILKTQSTIKQMPFSRKNTEILKVGSINRDKTQSDRSVASAKFRITQQVQQVVQNNTEELDNTFETDLSLQDVPAIELEKQEAQPELRNCVFLKKPQASKNFRGISSIQRTKTTATLEAQVEENRIKADKRRQIQLDIKLRQLMKDATKITPQNLNFYDQIFNWKQNTGQKIVQTSGGKIQAVPRKIKFGSLTQAQKSIQNLIKRPKSYQGSDCLVPIKNEQLLSINIVKNETSLHQRNNAQTFKETEEDDELNNSKGYLQSINTVSDPSATLKQVIGRISSASKMNNQQKDNKAGFPSHKPKSGKPNSKSQTRKFKEKNNFVLTNSMSKVAFNDAQNQAASSATVKVSSILKVAQSDKHNATQQTQASVVHTDIDDVIARQNSKSIETQTDSAVQNLLENFRQTEQMLKEQEERIEQQKQENESMTKQVQNMAEYMERKFLVQTSKQVQNSLLAQQADLQHSVQTSHIFESQHFPITQVHHGRSQSSLNYFRGSVIKHSPYKKLRRRSNYIHQQQQSFEQPFDYSKRQSGQYTNLSDTKQPTTMTISPIPRDVIEINQNDTVTVGEMTCNGEAQTIIEGQSLTFAGQKPTQSSLNKDVLNSMVNLSVPAAVIKRQQHSRNNRASFIGNRDLKTFGTKSMLLLKSFGNSRQTIQMSNLQTLGRGRVIPNLNKKFLQKHMQKTSQQPQPDCEDPEDLNYDVMFQQQIKRYQLSDRPTSGHKVSQQTVGTTCQVTGNKNNTAYGPAVQKQISERQQQTLQNLLRAPPLNEHSKITTIPRKQIKLDFTISAKRDVPTESPSVAPTSQNVNPVPHLLISHPLQNIKDNSDIIDDTLGQGNTSSTMDPDTFTKTTDKFVQKTPTKGQKLSRTTHSMSALDRHFNWQNTPLSLELLDQAAMEQKQKQEQKTQHHQKKLLRQQIVYKNKSSTECRSPRKGDSTSNQRSTTVIFKTSQQSGKKNSWKANTAATATTVDSLLKIAAAKGGLVSKETNKIIFEGNFGQLHKPLLVAKYSQVEKSVAIGTSTEAEAGSTTF